MTLQQPCCSMEEVDVFRQYEKLYRREPVPSSRRERRRRQRTVSDFCKFEDVVDFRNLDPSKPWSKLIKTKPVPERVSRHFIDNENAQMYVIEGHPGLVIITDALSCNQQFKWAKRALEEFSLGPYTNLWNPSQEITPLWKQLVHSRNLTPFRKLRWANIGRHYDWTAREYVNVKDMPDIDPDLAELFNEAVEISGIYSKGCAQAGIVNFYPSGTSMGGHLDDAESDMISPIISLSIGCSCIYLQGGKTKSQPPLPLWLKSGDLMIMGGNSRLCYHGVPLVTSGTMPEQLKELSDLENTLISDYLSAARININLRSVDVNTAN